jgi:DNA repair ATPase RecN
MMLKTTALLVTIATLSLAPLAAGAEQAGQAAAQRNQPARGRAARPNAPVLTPGEVVNMLDAYAILQAQEMLQLSEAQYGQFVMRLKTLQETRRRGQQARNKIVHQLRELAGPQVTQVDDNAVRAQLKALREQDDRIAADVRKAYDALDEVLDVRQQARFRLLEERLEARKIDLLMRARQGAPRGPGR